MRGSGEIAQYVTPWIEALAKIANGVDPTTLVAVFIIPFLISVVFRLWSVAVAIILLAALGFALRIAPEHRALLGFTGLMVASCYMVIIGFVEKRRRRVQADVTSDLESRLSYLEANESRRLVQQTRKSGPELHDEADA